MPSTAIPTRDRLLDVTTVHGRSMYGSATLEMALPEESISIDKQSSKKEHPLEDLDYPNEQGYSSIQDSAETFEMEEERRISREVPSPMKSVDCESLDYSYEDSEPLMKKPKGKSLKIKNKKSSDAIEKKIGLGSSKRNFRKMNCTKCEFETTSANSFVEHLRSEHPTEKSLNVIEKMGRSVSSKRNSREMNCSECEFVTTSVGSYITHLRRKHSTTLVLSNLALRCDCGVDALSEKHGLKCDITNYAVVRLRDGPIQRINDMKTTPQCLLCEEYPRSAVGYISHLKKHHNTVLSYQGIWLECSCGAKYRNANSDRKHSDECTRREYSLHKVAYM